MQDDVYGRSLARTSFTLVIAGAMALLPGVIGIYGVIAYAVSQRRREIGIRLALGAPYRELRNMFVRHGLVLAGAGAMVGIVASAGVTAVLKSLLFGVSPLDPITYFAVPVVLGIAAVIASYVPARRASLGRSGGNAPDGVIRSLKQTARCVHFVKSPSTGDHRKKTAVARPPAACRGANVPLA